MTWRKLRTPPLLNEALIPATASLTMDELVIRAEPTEVRRAAAWLTQMGEHYAVQPEKCSQLELCVNEVLTNILDHGGEGALAAPIYLQFSLQRHPDFCEAAVCVSDAGVKFDPLASAPTALPQSLAGVQPGGLGLVMIRKLADKLSYFYSDGRNYVNLSVRWNIAA